MYRTIASDSTAKGQTCGKE